ncbi:unnamed protein product [Didymodactylos carnosus]|uniref:Uncharacterized protein n=1 Tax=Didymodactylos carnosus TaxID=1234261 RepID=A0A814K7W1_9BILA|nr:unnamed protein product [Didymodactylos carnosus]CAF3817203.1 unnamed protein product [Didymodactylos carnosus]
MTRLFDLYAQDETDLLCDNIVETNSYWIHWPRTSSDIFPKAYWTGTFSPLVRWSQRLIGYHRRYMQLIHDKRLKFQFDIDYRFQEFIFATIAKIENLTIAVYSQQYSFIEIELGAMTDEEIVELVGQGKHIIHPVKHASILTERQPRELAQMMKMMAPKTNAAAMILVSTADTDIFLGSTEEMDEAEHIRTLLHS